MFKNLIVKGFRGIRNLEIESTSRFNIFVGSNNSGKTSLLEAIFICCAPLNMPVILSIITFRNGSFWGNQRYIFEQIKWLFSGPLNNRSTEFILKSKWKGVKREIKAIVEDYAENEDIDEKLIKQAVGSNGHTIFSTSASAPVDINLRRDSGAMLKAVSIGKVILYFKSDNQDTISQDFNFEIADNIQIKPPLIKTDIPAKYQGSILQKGPEVGVKEWTKTVRRGHHKKVLEIISRIDPEIENVTILQPEGGLSELYAEHKELGTIPLTILGDGIRRIISIATGLVECENGVFCIDEFENAIHTVALENFVSWFVEIVKELKIQVFATTHSIECVDAIIKGTKSNLKDLSLFRLKSNNNGVFCKKISGEMLEGLRYELGQDVRW